jgi:DNA-binding GntR family transcriptional regulator
MNKIILKLQDHELLSQKAYKTLKEAIVRGDLESNTKLTLNEIAQHMGISITPIREAANQLASEGLIKLVPNKGIIINKISIDDFQEILQIRSALDGLIAELAASRITDKEIDAMMDIVNNMETAVKNDNRLYYNELDIKFHDYLLKIADNHKLMEVYNHLISQVYKFRLRTLKLAYRMTKSLEEHKSIALAVKGKNPVKANRESRRHIDSILKSLEEDEARKQKEKRDVL